MSRRMYKVGTVARIAKVTIRTLHYYDEIGLLVPSGHSGAGYRLYTDSDIERLQQIRFHRELGFALEEIRSVLDAPDFEARSALRRHRKRLAQRLRETGALVALIDRMLSTPEGGSGMSAEARFDGFEPQEHEAEAKERWGDTPAWQQARSRTAAYGPQDWGTIKAEDARIIKELAACQSAGDAADSEAAMAAAERHRQHIDRWFYACSPLMHEALAQMYTTDARFAQYFDRHGEDLSSYVAAAIRANAARS